MKGRNKYRTSAGRLNYDVAHGAFWFVGIIAIAIVMVFQAIFYILLWILQLFGKKKEVVENNNDGNQNEERLE